MVLRLALAFRLASAFEAARDARQASSRWRFFSSDSGTGAGAMLLSDRAGRGRAVAARQHVGVRGESAGQGANC